MQGPSKPEFQATKRLSYSRQISIYFILGKDNTGESTYVFAAVEISLRDDLMAALEQGIVPDFVTVLELGYGTPSPEVKAKMRMYYGFEFDKIQ